MRTILTSIFLLMAVPYLAGQVSNNGEANTLEQNEETIPVIHGVITQPDKCKSGTGSLQIAGYSPAGNLQYSIDGNTYQLSNKFDHLPAGSYTAYVMDDRGMVTSRSAVIPADAQVSIESMTIQPSSCTHHTGAIQLNLEGGTEPYTYVLNDIELFNDEALSNLAPGNYNLIIRDAAGCETDTTITIEKSPCPLYIPNIFSPNGDGVNDYFRIQAPGNENITITRFLIFDRWGIMVYEKFNMPVQMETGWWDGTHKRFTMSPGTFSYYIEVQFENGEKETYKGTVTLIR